MSVGALRPYEDSKVASRQGILGRETLVAPGIRITGKLPANFDYSLEGVLERGAFANDSSVRVPVMSRLAIRFIPCLEAAPSGPVRLRERRPPRDPSVVRTFDQFYPSNHDVFGLTDVFGWQIRPRRLNMIFIRQSPCMFTAWRNFLCREYQRLRLFGRWRRTGASTVRRFRK